MKPGRELDVLIAEKVMGWSRDESGHMYTPAVGYHEGIMEHPPNYSTDIAAAWEVVEKLHGRKLWVDIRLEISAKGLSKTTCWISSIASTSADTAPHAICLAALKAVGALNDIS